VYCGESHVCAYRLLQRDIAPDKVVIDNAEEGFVTDLGVFLNRKQAYFEAQRCGQLIQENENESLGSGNLIRSTLP
jgi:hypothetical protein